MPWRINQVKYIALAIRCLVFEPYRIGLDGNPALALQIHSIEHLRFHFALAQGAGELDQSVSEGRFAMVDVRDNGKVADLGSGGGHGLLPLAPLPRGFREVRHFIRHPFPGVGIFWRIALLQNDRPGLGVLAVEVNPARRRSLYIGQNGLSWAFWLADAAVNALVRMDDEHILAFIKAVHRADFDAILVLAADAGVGDNVGHRGRSFLDR